MKTNNSLREEHNRQIQNDIDVERKEIDRLKSVKDKFIPEIMKLDERLMEINNEVRKTDIAIDCSERKILVLSDRFWKNDNAQKTNESSTD